MALPGQYTVRLTVNGRNYSSQLTVKIDPRVKAAPDSLEQEFNLAMRLSSMMTESSQAVMQAHSVLDQVKKISSQANGPILESLKSMEQKVSEILKKPDSDVGPASRLSDVNGDVGTLYADVEKADAAPNTALVEATAEAGRNLSDALKRWNELKSKGLLELNRRLEAANLPVINPESKPSSEEPGKNEE
jgi:hypothetical protein